VAAIVVGGAAPVFLVHHHLPCGAEHDPLERVREVGFVDGVVVPACRQERRLVREVREVRSDHAGRRRGDAAEVDAGHERHAARVHLEDTTGRFAGQTERRDSNPRPPA
jgi:hypothetical protein